MRIVMIGTGYVGLVSGACLADSGHVVACVDVQADKIARLKAGEIPIYEPGLQDMIVRATGAGVLTFTTSAAEVVPSADCVFIAVGTPESAGGAADLRAVWAVADSLAPLLDLETVVIVKSTVPVGVNRSLSERLRSLTGRDVRVASNPEFLKEGHAVQDFTHPDRVVIGAEDPAAAARVRELYQAFLPPSVPILEMGWESAEMTKYVANCLLATKISFINEMANLCERVGADIQEVRQGIGHDQRIGFSFFAPGPGYGGSCFPKDVRALLHVSRDKGLQPRMLETVDEINTAQKSVLFQKLALHFQERLDGRRIAIWGLAFKPETDDIREAPALVLIDQLLRAGAQVRVHDPVAMPHVESKYGNRLEYAGTPLSAVRDADALAIVTEWPHYREVDVNDLKVALGAHPVIFDGRNLWDARTMREAGFQYSGIGVK